LRIQNTHLFVNILFAHLFGGILIDQFDI